VTLTEQQLAAVVEAACTQLAELDAVIARLGAANAALTSRLKIAEGLLTEALPHIPATYRRGVDLRRDIRHHMDGEL
jgi:hypothetical protein